LGGKRWATEAAANMAARKIRRHLAFFRLSPKITRFLIFLIKGVLNEENF